MQSGSLDGKLGFCEHGDGVFCFTKSRDFLGKMSVNISREAVHH